MAVVDFCPASKAARRLTRIEECATLVDRSLARMGADAMTNPALLRSLETVQLKLSLDAERARDDLANASAVSSGGAIAQLLAAIRDLRVNDDDQRARAIRLETQATDFLARSGLLDPRNARRISRTHATTAFQPASRAISSSDRS